MSKELATITDSRILQNGLPTYLPAKDLTNMLEGPLELDKICQYLNEIHNPHGVYYAFTKGNNGLKVTGKNVSQFFVKDPTSQFLISTKPTVNQTCIEHTDKILEKLEKKNVGILTAFKRNWQTFYFRTKTNIFVSYGFFGSLNVLQAAGSASLATANGAASLSIGGIMALSFLGGLTLNLVSVYIPNGPIKESVKFSAKVVGIPTAIGLWTYNKVVGVVIETPINFIVGKNETIDYTIEMARDLGFYESPFNISFNETIHQMKYWSDQGLIIWQRRNGG
jgi:hypothetical protein